MSHERAIPMPFAPGDFEIRSTADGHQFIGYAAVWGAESAPMPYREKVAPGAFATTLTAPPSGRQTFVVDHDNTKLLSSTATTRLRLSEDSKGLLADSEWPDTSYARDVRELGDMGELGGMSFEFSATAKGAPFTNGGKDRTLREVKLYHVTVLTGKVPAYSATTAGFRALADAAAANFDDVMTLFDALREGRRLTDDEWNLLGKAVTVVAPEGQRWAAAEDASYAASLLSGILTLQGQESTEPDQLALLKTASGALQQFIDAESGEVGTADDTNQMMSAPRPKLAEARALFPAN